MAILLGEDCDSFTVLDFIEFWDLRDEDHPAISYLLHDLSRTNKHNRRSVPVLRIIGRTRHPEFRGLLNVYQLIKEGD